MRSRQPSGSRSACRAIVNNQSRRLLSVAQTAQSSSAATIATFTADALTRADTIVRGVLHRRQPGALEGRQVLTVRSGLVVRQVATARGSVQVNAVQFDDEVEIASRLTQALTQFTGPTAVEPCFGSLQHNSRIGPLGLLLKLANLVQVRFDGLSPL